jgi:hypothetical protein
MPADQPFVPIVASGVAGATVIVLVTSSASTAGTVVSTTSATAENLLVTNPNTVTIFVRMSREANPTASSTDTPIPPNTSRLFGNPNPVGTSAVAVIASLFGSGSGQAYAMFTPGNAGVE